jgi:hypothetical protein
MQSTSTSQQNGRYSEPKRLHGVPGNVYVLRNTGLKEDLLQIGLSRRSGWSKALELNRDKNNTIPGSYECVFELRAQDGGGALDAIFQAIHNLRRGRREQDFFEINVHQAEAVITQCVREADLKFQTRYRRDTALREYLEKERAEAEPEVRSAPVVREGIFKKAISWMVN